jgi:hypothetical protein
MDVFQLNLLLWVYNENCPETQILRHRIIYTLNGKIYATFIPNLLIYLYNVSG